MAGMNGEPAPAPPVVQLQLQAPPNTAGSAAGTGDVLRYADTRTDRLADQLSADREMTWRLARANGLAATGMGVVLGLSYLGTIAAGTLDTLGTLAPLLGLAAPGGALLAALAGIRGGRRRPVITALAAGAWLGCAWAATAVGVLFLGYRAGKVAAYVTPAIVAA